jgi:hypothetical protein
VVLDELVVVDRVEYVLDVVLNELVVVLRVLNELVVVLRVE